jgi:hypothetical protein
MSHDLTDNTHPAIMSSSSDTVATTPTPYWAILPDELKLLILNNLLDDLAEDFKEDFFESVMMVTSWRWHPTSTEVVICHTETVHRVRIYKDQVFQEFSADIVTVWNAKMNDYMGELRRLRAAAVEDSCECTNLKTLDDGLHVLTFNPGSRFWVALVRSK